jgi:hypothetical protein
MKLTKPIEFRLRGRIVLSFEQLNVDSQFGEKVAIQDAVAPEGPHGQTNEWEVSNHHIFGRPSARRIEGLVR